MESKRKLKTLKMKPELFKRVEKKRKREKKFETFHKLGINLLTNYSK